jgi:hypothetical protein
VTAPVESVVAVAVPTVAVPAMGVDATIVGIDDSAGGDAVAGIGAAVVLVVVACIGA